MPRLPVTATISAMTTGKNSRKVQRTTSAFWPLSRTATGQSLPWSTSGHGKAKTQCSRSCRLVRRKRFHPPSLANPATCWPWKTSLKSIQNCFCEHHSYRSRDLVSPVNAQFSFLFAAQKNYESRKFEQATTPLVTDGSESKRPQTT